MLKKSELNMVTSPLCTRTYPGKRRKLRAYVSEA